MADLSDVEALGVLKGVFGLLAWVGHIVLEGFVTVKLWAWHIAPLGPPEIDLGTGVGIWALVGLWTYSVSSIDNDISATRTIVYGYVAALTCLLIGWVAA